MEFLIVVQEAPAGMNSQHNSDLKAANGDSAELPGPADKFDEEDHEEEYEFNCACSVA